MIYINLNETLTKELKKAKNKNQTIKATMLNSQESLMQWKDGYIQTILLVAFFVGTSKNKILQKEMKTLYYEFFTYLHDSKPFIETPLDILYQASKLWYKALIFKTKNHL